MTRRLFAKGDKTPYGTDKQKIRTTKKVIFERREGLDTGGRFEACIDYRASGEEGANEIHNRVAQSRVAVRQHGYPVFECHE
jgi:hypothetical protein